ncbi:MAG: acyl carrier protein [Clostridia bacterium]|jgi:acyl carrier protein|nr:acyl carrier protein [Clostridia bacterium]
MLEEVKKALAKQLRKDVSTITESSRIKADLGADSLDVLQLLMTIEEDFGITIPDEKLAEFETVGDIAAFLDSVGK